MLTFPWTKLGQEDKKISHIKNILVISNWIIDTAVQNAKAFNWQMTACNMDIKFHTVKVLNEVSCLVNIGHFLSGKSLGNIQKVHSPQEQERDYSN